MRYNPFTPHRIAKASIFAGRAEELADLEQALRQTSYDNPVSFLVVGERGIGKSSLIVRVMELATAKHEDIESKLPFLTLMVDLDEQDTSASIAQKIGSELTRQITPFQSGKKVAKDIWGFLKRWEVLGVRYHEGDIEAPLWATTNELAETLRVTSDILRESHGGILILIDEADKAPIAANLGALIKRLTERLAKHGVDNVSFGLSGHCDLIENLRKSHESSPRAFRMFRLKPLTKDECLAVIRSGIGEANSRNAEAVTIEVNAEEWIAENCDGYPHFLQQYAFCAFEESKDALIDLRDVWNAAYRENGALDQLGATYFENIFLSKSLTDLARKILVLLAAAIGSMVSIEWISEQAGIEKSKAHEVVKSLVEVSAVERHPVHLEQIQISSSAFASWIRVRMRESPGR